MAKLKLPGIINESCWFYAANEELCKPHLGKPYISYSSVSSWAEYKDNFIKEKFAKIKLPDGIYAQLGNFVGHAVEHGEFPDNPHGFTGMENLDLIKLRPEGAEYEKMILIDRGEYVIIGFIDVYHEVNNVANVTDMKSGGSKKEETYKKEDYIQVVLYAYAIEQTGKKIGKTNVYFIRRTGSHISPPLNISTEQFEIPLEYSPERVNYALKKVDQTVKEISELFTTFEKYFT